MSHHGNSGFYSDTHWRASINFVDEDGVAIALTGRTFAMQVYRKSGDLIFSFDNDLDQASNGSVDETELWLGHVIVDADEDQHSAVPPGSYLWELRETVAIDNHDYAANGSMEVGRPGDRSSSFTVRNSSTGTVVSATVVALKGDQGDQGDPGEDGATGQRGQPGASTLSASQGVSTGLRTVDGYGLDAGIVAEDSVSRELIPLAGVDPRGVFRISHLGGAHPEFYPHPDIGFAITDREGNVRFYMDHVGGLHAATEVGDSKFYVDDDGQLNAFMADGTILKLTDEAADASVFGGVEWRGNNVLYIRRALANTDPVLPFAGGDTLETLQTLFDAESLNAGVTSLSTFIMVGQSQAEAAAAETVLDAHLSPVAAGQIMMFGNGPRALAFQRSDKLDVVAPWSNFMKLRDYAEQDDLGVLFGGLDAETIGWQRASDRKTLYSLAPAAAGEIMINCAIGSTSITQHSTRGPRANWQRAFVAQRICCLQADLTPGFSGMSWRAGAADRAQTLADMKAAIVTLRDYVLADAADLGGVEDLTESYLYVAQSADPYTSLDTRSQVAPATLHAALENSGICCVGPDYIFQVDGSEIHFTNLGSRQAGAYQAYFEYLCAQAGTTVAPLYVTSGILSGGNTVLLTVHNPLGTNLVIDTSWVSNPALTAGHEDQPYGFKFRQTGGNSVTVSAVAVNGTTQIILTLSDTPTGTAKKIGIGDQWNDVIGGPGTGGLVPGGARCCIRNTGPVHAIAPNGRLDMYLCVDEITLT